MMTNKCWAVLPHKDLNPHCVGKFLAPANSGPLAVRRFRTKLPGSQQMIILAINYLDMDAGILTCSIAESALGTKNYEDSSRLSLGLKFWNPTTIAVYCFVPE